LAFFINEGRITLFETAKGQIWPFYFFGPGNPVAVVPIHFYSSDDYFHKNSKTSTSSINCTGQLKDSKLPLNLMEEKME